MQLFSIRAAPRTFKYIIIKFSAEDDLRKGLLAE